MTTFLFVFAFIFPFRDFFYVFRDVLSFALNLLSFESHIVFLVPVIRVLIVKYRCIKKITCDPGGLIFGIKMLVQQH